MKCYGKKYRKTALCAALAAAMLVSALLAGGCAAKIGTPETAAPPADTTLPAAESTTVYIPPAETAAPVSETATAVPTTVPPATVPPATVPPAAESTTVPPTTAPPATEPTAAPPATETNTQAPVPPAVPGTKEEIVSFLAGAINNVKLNGAAGYTRREYDKLGEINVTGKSMVDNAIKGIITGLITTESQAKPQTFAKGSPEAALMLPGWTLSDPGKVVSASLLPADGNYCITVVLQDEDTPQKGSSHLAEVGTVLFGEDVEEKMKDISILKDYEDLHLKYTDYTVSAVVSPEGRLGSLTYRGNVSVELARVEVVMMTLQNMRFGLEKTVSYSDFTY